LLNTGGYTGINEMYRDKKIEPHLKSKIDEAETSPQK
jgi:hypothetical protein